MLSSMPIVTELFGNGFPAGQRGTAAKEDSSGLFGRLLGKSLSPKNCLGVRCAQKVQGAAPGSEKTLSLKDLRSIMASLKKALSKANQTDTNLVIKQPDELALTQFLRAFGLKEGEIAQAKREMSTGREGEYSLAALFVLLDKHTTGPGVKGLLQESPLSPQETAALTGLGEGSAVSPRDDTAPIYLDAPLGAEGTGAGAGTPAAASAGVGYDNVFPSQANVASTGAVQGSAFANQENGDLTGMSRNWSIPEAGAVLPQSEGKTPLPQEGISPSDRAAINGMLEDLGLSPSEIVRLSEGLSTVKGFVSLDELAQAVKNESKRYPAHTVPLQEGHEERLTDLLTRLGLSEEEIRQTAAAAGLGDGELSLKKLASVLDKAADIVDRRKSPVQTGKFLSDLEHLLSRVKVKEPLQSAGRADAGVLRPWQDKWLEGVQKEYAQLDSGHPAVAATVAIAEKVQAEEGGTPRHLEEFVPDPVIHKGDPKILMPGEGSSAVAGRIETTVDAASNTVRQAVHPDAVFPQIMDRVLASVRLKDDKVVMRLFPPQLGEVKVNLVLKDNHLATTFIIDNQHVKEIVESSLPQLRTALLQQGITMGECNVELNEDFSRFFGFQERSGGRGAQAGPGDSSGQGIGSLGDIESASMDSRASPGQGIDFFA